MHECSCLLYLAVVDDLLHFSILPLSNLVLGKVLRQGIGHGSDWHHRVLAHQVPVAIMHTTLIFSLY